MIDYSPQYDKWRASRAAEATRAAAALSGSMSMATYALRVRHAANVATANASEIARVSFALPRQKAEIADIAAQLRRLADAAEARASQSPTTMLTPATALALVRRHQAWLGIVATTAIARHHTTVGAAARAPAAAAGAAGALLKLPRELVQRLLGLPGWVVPVAAVAAGVVVLGPYLAPMLGRSVAGYSRARSAG